MCLRPCISQSPSPLHPSPRRGKKYLPSRLQLPELSAWCNQVALNGAVSFSDIFTITLLSELLGLSCWLRNCCTRLAQGLPESPLLSSRMASAAPPPCAGQQLPSPVFRLRYRHSLGKYRSNAFHFCGVSPGFAPACRQSIEATIGEAKDVPSTYL